MDPNLPQFYINFASILHNLSFLKSIFHDCELLDKAESDILNQIKQTNSSMPFNLGAEKKINPFPLDVLSQSLFWSNSLIKNYFKLEKVFPSYNY